MQRRCCGLLLGKLNPKYYYRCGNHDLASTIHHEATASKWSKDCSRRSVRSWYFVSIKISIEATNVLISVQRRRHLSNTSQIHHDFRLDRRRYHVEFQRHRDLVVIGMLHCDYLL